MREKKKTELAVKPPEAMTELLSKRGAKAVSVSKKTDAKIKEGFNTIAENVRSKETIKTELSRLAPESDLEE